MCSSHCLLTISHFKQYAVSVVFFPSLKQNLMHAILQVCHFLCKPQSQTEDTTQQSYKLPSHSKQEMTQQTLLYLLLVVEIVQAAAESACCPSRNYLTIPCRQHHDQRHKQGRSGLLPSVSGIVSNITIGTQNCTPVVLGTHV